MTKAYRNEFKRSFLIDGLPEPLTRASSHLQIFDNYIEGTRLRLRSVRTPETKEWSWFIQQRDWNDAEPGECLVSEIELNEAEHERFAVFEGAEIRKNRYSLVIDEINFDLDVFLGTLWGLNIACSAFESQDEARKMSARDFGVIELTDEPFFRGENLVNQDLGSVRAEIERIIGKTA